MILSNNVKNKLKYVIIYLKKDILTNQSVRRLSESLKFATLKVTNPHEYVYHVQFNRPEKRNAMNPNFFKCLKI